MSSPARRDERSSRRRRFGLLLVPLAIACAVGGVALLGSGGLVGVIGLVLLAQGLGMGVAAGTFIVGDNPLGEKNQRDG